MPHVCTNDKHLCTPSLSDMIETFTRLRNDIGDIPVVVAHADGSGVPITAAVAIGRAGEDHVALIVDLRSKDIVMETFSDIDAKSEPFPTGHLRPVPEV